MYAKSLGLTSTVLQGHTFDSIAHPIAQLQNQYPTVGAEVLHIHLQNDFDIRVSR
jgi:hypothetical protein